MLGPLGTLERANRRIDKTWGLKDVFELFWESRVSWAAERFLKSWSTSAIRSRVEFLREFPQMLGQHLSGVLDSVNIRLTNTVAEGLRQIVRIVSNRRIPHTGGFQRYGSPCPRELEHT